MDREPRRAQPLHVLEPGSSASSCWRGSRTWRDRPWSTSITRSTTTAAAEPWRSCWRSPVALDLGRPTELLVVNDGSSDRTGVLERLKSEHSTDGHGSPHEPRLRGGAQDRHPGGASPRDRDHRRRRHVPGGSDRRPRRPCRSGRGHGGRRADGRGRAHPLAAQAGQGLPVGSRSLRDPDPRPELRAAGDPRDLVLRYEAILPEGFSFTTTITLSSLTITPRRLRGHRLRPALRLLQIRPIGTPSGSPR